MDMGNLIGLLLLIVPGFISLGVYEKLNTDRDFSNQFEKTIISLIFSVFVLLLTFCFLLRFQVGEISPGMSLLEIEKKFYEPIFIIQYGLLALLSSFIVAYAWSLLNPGVTFKVLNFFRSLGNKTDICKEDSLEEICFQSGNVIEIYSLEGNLIERGVVDKKKVGEGCSFLEDEVPEGFFHKSKRTGVFVLKDKKVVVYENLLNEQ